jgi:MFS family permease
MLKELQDVHYPYIGLTMLAGTISLAITSAIVNKLVEKYSVLPIIISGFLFLFISTLLFSITSYAGYYTDSIYQVIFALIIFGVGWGFILSPSITLGITATKVQDSGNSMGIIGTIHNFGGAVGLAISVMIFDYLSKNDSKIMFAAPMIFVFFIALTATVSLWPHYKKRINKTKNTHS